MAQISPSGSFASLVNLAGVGTPDPPLTGANLPLFGEKVLQTRAVLYPRCANAQGFEAVSQDNPSAMLKCSKVSQGNFIKLTATLAIPIEFQVVLEVCQRNRYNDFYERLQYSGFVGGLP